MTSRAKTPLLRILIDAKRFIADNLQGAADLDVPRYTDIIVRLNAEIERLNEELGEKE